MIANFKTVAKFVPIAALLLSACTSDSKYKELEAQNQQLQQQVTNLQREAQFVEAGDLLFPSGGFQLSQAGMAELSKNIVPKLVGLQNAKVVVYGYTDNVPVGSALQQQGINDNLTLSSRRAGAVVNYLISQGVNPNLVSERGLGDADPVAPNDTPQGRAQSRRVELTLAGPGT